MASKTYSGPKAIVEASKRLGTGNQLVVLHHVPTRKTKAMLVGNQNACLKVDDINEWISFVCHTPLSVEELKSEIKMRREWVKAA